MPPRTSDGPKKTGKPKAEPWRRPGWKSNLAARVQRALVLLHTHYAGADGPRKDWVVDQVVRALVANDAQYQSFLADFDDGCTCDSRGEHEDRACNRWRDMLSKCTPP